MSKSAKDYAEQCLDLHIPMTSLTDTVAIFHDVPVLREQLSDPTLPMDHKMDIIDRIIPLDARDLLKLMCVEDQLDLLEEEPQKVLMIDLKNTGRLARFREKNLEWEKGKCTSFFSCREYLEYCPLDTSKGTGVSCLTKMLNLPLDCTVAVGDEENDIAMLNAAHIGVAVKNATPEVKAAADYVTEHDNNHNAIAEVIERFIL